MPKDHLIFKTTSAAAIDSATMVTIFGTLCKI